MTFKPNQMMRNEETYAKKAILIKRTDDAALNAEKYRKQKFEICGELSVCMSILTPKLSKTRQRDLNT